MNFDEYQVGAKVMVNDKGPIDLVLDVGTLEGWKKTTTLTRRPMEKTETETTYEAIVSLKGEEHLLPMEAVDLVKESYYDAWDLAVQSGIRTTKETFEFVFERYQNMLGRKVGLVSEVGLMQQKVFILYAVKKLVTVDKREYLAELVPVTEYERGCFVPSPIVPIDQIRFFNI